jgi:YHYH protein
LRSNYIDWNDDGASPTITPSVAVSCSGTVVSVASNGVPNFDALGTGMGGSNVAYQTNQKTWVFPQNPARAATTTSLTHVLGPIGVMVNGVQFYTVTEGPQDNYADAVLNGFTNYCGGHVAQFHFHGYPSCFFSKNTVGTTRTFLPDKTPGTVIAYAFDGFPVKTPFEACTSGTDCVNGVRELVSSYQYTGNKSYSTEDASVYNVYVAGYNNSTLDKCNGKTDAAGNYAYYATKTYPYYLGCYTGTPTTNR